MSTCKKNLHINIGLIETLRFIHNIFIAGFDTNVTSIQLGLEITKIGFDIKKNAFQAKIEFRVSFCCT